MQMLVRHLVDQGLDSLDLAHTFLQCDPVIHRVVIALGAGIDLLKADGNRAGKATATCLRSTLLAAAPSPGRLGVRACPSPDAGRSSLEPAVPMPAGSSGSSL